MINGFSIIICTYNPDRNILSRLLNALQKFQTDSTFGYEFILVDNNSIIPIYEYDEVKHFISSQTVSLLHESKPGLTSARIAGYKEAKYNWIIFFDDDNEPSPNYLNEAGRVISTYPTVGCWGPGKIQVEFIGPVQDSWILTKKEVFQERETDNVQFGNTQHWQDFYPYGTGIIVRKEILIEYIYRINANQYTLSDRKGKNLSSGGDVQIVLTGISMGYYAGISPSISLNHLIKAKKASTNYILKLVYGTASAYVLAYNQVFKNDLIKPDKATNTKIIRKFYSLFRIHYKRCVVRKDFLLLASQKLGEMNAHNLAFGSKKPFLLRIGEKLINV